MPQKKKGVKKKSTQSKESLSVKLNKVFAKYIPNADPAQDAITDPKDLFQTVHELIEGKNIKFFEHVICKAVELKAAQFLKLFYGAYPTPDEAIKQGKCQVDDKNEATARPWKMPLHLILKEEFSEENKEFLTQLFEISDVKILLLDESGDKRLVATNSSDFTRVADYVFEREIEDELPGFLFDHIYKVKGDADEKALSCLIKLASKQNDPVRLAKLVNENSGQDFKDLIESEIANMAQECFNFIAEEFPDLKEKYSARNSCFNAFVSDDYDSFEKLHDQNKSELYRFLVPYFKNQILLHKPNCQQFMAQRKIYTMNNNLKWLFEKEDVCLKLNFKKIHETNPKFIKDQIIKAASKDEPGIFLEAFLTILRSARDKGLDKSRINAMRAAYIQEAQNCATGECAKIARYENWQYFHPVLTCDENISLSLAVELRYMLDVINNVQIDFITLVKVLLKNGANLNDLNKDRSSPVQYAIRLSGQPNEKWRDNSEISQEDLSVLIPQDYDPKNQDPKEQNIFELAIECKKPQVIRAIVAKLGKVRCQNLAKEVFRELFAKNDEKLTAEEEDVKKTLMELGFSKDDHRSNSQSKKLKQTLQEGVSFEAALEKLIANQEYRLIVNLIKDGSSTAQEKRIDEQPLLRYLRSSLQVDGFCKLATLILESDEAGYAILEELFFDKDRDGNNLLHLCVKENNEKDLSWVRSVLKKQEKLFLETDKSGKDLLSLIMQNESSVFLDLATKYSQNNAMQQDIARQEEEIKQKTSRDEKKKERQEAEIARQNTQKEERKQQVIAAEKRRQEQGKMEREIEDLQAELNSLPLDSSSEKITLGLEIKRITEEYRKKFPQSFRYPIDKTKAEKNSEKELAHNARGRFVKVTPKETTIKLEKQLKAEIYNLKQEIAQLKSDLKNESTQVEKAQQPDIEKLQLIVNEKNTEIESLAQQLETLEQEKMRLQNTLSQENQRLASQLQQSNQRADNYHFLYLQSLLIANEYDSFQKHLTKDALGFIDNKGNYLLKQALVSRKNDFFELIVGKMVEFSVSLNLFNLKNRDKDSLSVIAVGQRNYDALDILAKNKYNIFFEDEQGVNTIDKIFAQGDINSLELLHKHERLEKSEIETFLKNTKIKLREDFEKKLNELYPELPGKETKLEIVKEGIRDLVRDGEKGGYNNAAKTALEKEKGETKRKRIEEEKKEKDPNSPQRQMVVLRHRGVNPVKESGKNQR